MFNKSKVNFVIDALMFLCLMAIAGIGFLMKFVLIPGKERWIKYGRNVDLSLLGMDRHEWGTIHLVIGFILLGLLVLHIILHWKMILGIYHRLIGSRKARRIISSVFIIACVTLVILPFIVNPEVQELGRGEGRVEHGYVEETEETIEHPENKSSIEVRGYMTLIEVAEKYNVPTEYLKKHLDIPKSTSDEERLSWLRKRHGFTMRDVKRIIDEYHKSH